MTLTQAIQSIPDWRLKTAEELHILLNEVHTTPDPTPYTFVSLGDALTSRGFNGSDIRSKVSTTMLRIDKAELALPQGYEDKRGDIAGAYIAMAATKEGLSLHLPERQQLIGLLAQLGGWPTGYMEAVLSLGYSQYVLYSCSLQEVEAALAEIELQERKSVLYERLRTKYNSDITLVDVWDGSGEEPVL